MTVLHPHLTSAYKVRRLRITLPLVPHLVDNQRYWLPGTEPELDGQDLRAFSRPKIGKIVRPVRTRAWLNAANQSAKAQLSRSTPRRRAAD